LAIVNSVIFRTKVSGNPRNSAGFSPEYEAEKGVGKVRTLPRQAAVLSLGACGRGVLLAAWQGGVDTVAVIGTARLRVKGSPNRGDQQGRGVQERTHGAAGESRVDAVAVVRAASLREAARAVVSL